jgi:hypothetical protein
VPTRSVRVTCLAQFIIWIGIYLYHAWSCQEIEWGTATGDAAVDASALLAPACTVANIDCTTVTAAQLQHLRQPLSWDLPGTAAIHGVSLSLQLACRERSHH